MKEQHTMKNDHFIDRLVKVCGDRGAAAELRRYWSLATRHYAYPVLGRLGAVDPRRPDAITSALFAVHPHHSGGGRGIGRAALALGERKENKHPYDSQFRRLLASDSLEDVSQQLYRLFKRLEREGIAVDYNKTLWDLRNWAKKAEDVKTRWAMDFWQAPAEFTNTLDT